MPETSALEEERARGMPGAQCTRSLVRAYGVEYAHEYSQRRHRITSGIPHAMVLRLIRALPGDEFLLPPSPRGLNGISCPGWVDDASARAWHQQRMPGPHDFAVRNNAARLACRSSLTRLQARPAISVARTTSSSRPPHPAPNVRDDRDTPLVFGTGCANDKFDLGISRSDLFLLRGLDKNSR
jgi:hypothetical protein